MKVGSEQELVRKYTGWTVSPEMLTEVSDFGDAVSALADIERELRETAERLARIAARVLANLDAGPDDSVYALNPLGELQNASRLDVDIAYRSAAIARLQRATWRLPQSALSRP